MARDVITSFYFLPRDPKWLKQKPYTLKFQPVEQFPIQNADRIEQPDILVKDIRGNEAAFSFELNGFAVMSLDVPEMTLDDYCDNQKVVNVFLAAVGDRLRTFLGAKRVQIFDYVVRQSHPGYPIATGEKYPYKQPANIMHLDAVPQEASTQARMLNPNEAEFLVGQRHQYVNVWKPLVGPVENWPLALCDRSSVNQVDDIVVHDAVFAQTLVETGELHFNKDQKFFYLSDQRVDEALVFLQADSVLGHGVPHASFELPEASKLNKTRESIEIRTLVYY